MHAYIYRKNFHFNSIRFIEVKKIYVQVIKALSYIKKCSLTFDKFFIETSWNFHVRLLLIKFHKISV